MKRRILAALLLFIVLSCLLVNVIGSGGLEEVGISKYPTRAVIEPGENLTIYVTVGVESIEGLIGEELYSVEIRDKIPEGFELISGNTSMNISKHECIDLYSGSWRYVGLSYVLKAQKPGVFLFDPANVTLKDNPEDASPLSPHRKIK
jgi:hypothetical protein